MKQLDKHMSRRTAMGLMAAVGVLLPSTAHAQFDISIGGFGTDDLRNIGKMLKGLNLDEEDEIRLGNDYFGAMVDISGGAYANRSVQADMERFAAPLFETSERPAFSWEVVVLDDNSLNAWAMPGGKVGVNKGLLRYVDNEHELAAVLAHEVGHVEKSHALEEMKKKSFVDGMSGVAQKTMVSTLEGDAAAAAGVGSALVAMPLLRMVTQGYARGSEEEADQHIGTVFNRTGHDIQKGAQIYQTLLETIPKKSKGRTSLFAGHPDTKKRYEAVMSLSGGGSGVGAGADAFASMKKPFPTRQYYLRSKG